MTTREDSPLADFKCHMCGACCRIKNGIVRASPLEIARMSQSLGISEGEFIDRYTDIAPDRAGLILKSRPDDPDACIMLSDANGCIVHSSKPDKCRTFPHDWQNPDSAQICPALATLNLGNSQNGR